MKRCLSSVVLVLTLALAIVVPASATAQTFGAEVGSDFAYQMSNVWSPQQVMASLNALYAAGGRVGRADSGWAGTEPHAPVHGHHTYNWAYDDLVVGEMAQARLRWEPTLEFAPKWAQQHRPNVLHLKSGPFVTPLPPAKNSNFGAYAGAFMKRYGARGSFWASHPTLPYLPVTTVEVWNEPDDSHTWGPHVNLQDYARMYEVVRSAIHRVNPHAQVMTGGLAWTESSLPRLLKALKGKPVDAVAIHPYAATPKGTIALARYAIAQMRKYHRGATPLIVNEYGWTSQQGTWGSTSPRNVDRYAYQALVGLAKLRIAQILPFLWADPSWGLSTGSYAQAVALVTHRG
jgi:Cellulase (glycosyl hydrolase family 5)